MMGTDGYINNQQVVKRDGNIHTVVLRDKDGMLKAISSGIRTNTVYDRLVRNDLFEGVPTDIGRTRLYDADGYLIAEG